MFGHVRKKTGYRFPEPTMLIFIQDEIIKLCNDILTFVMLSLVSSGAHEEETCAGMRLQQEVLTLFLIVL